MAISVTLRMTAVIEQFLMTHLLQCMVWYGDSAGNTVEENSSDFSLIRMH